MYSQPCRMRPRQLLGGALEVLVVAVRVAGQQPPHDVMEVVGPDAVEPQPPPRAGSISDARFRWSSRVHDDRPGRRRAAPVSASSATMCGRAVVEERVRRVEAQAVEVGTRAIQCTALSMMKRADGSRPGPSRLTAPPHGVACSGRDVGGLELRQVGAFGPEMVVDDVEDHGEAERVRGIDEARAGRRGGRRRATARTARRRRSPSCGGRGNRRPASARSR